MKFLLVRNLPCCFSSLVCKFLFPLCHTRLSNFERKWMPQENLSTTYESKLFPTFLQENYFASRPFFSLKIYHEKGRREEKILTFGLTRRISVGSVFSLSESFKSGLRHLQGGVSSPHFHISTVKLTLFRGLHILTAWGDPFPCSSTALYYPQAQNREKKRTKIIYLYFYMRSDNTSSPFTLDT